MMIFGAYKSQAGFIRRSATGALYRAGLLMLGALLLMIAPGFANAAPSDINAGTESQPILDIQEVTTESGLTAWLVQDSSLPVIAMHFAFRDAGAVLDAPDKQGLTLMASNTMDEGAGEYDSQHFQKLLADHAITLRFGSSRDHFSGTLRTLSRHKDLAFNLLEQAINAPRFDPEPVARMRAANLARIRSSLSNPNWIAARIMNDRAFAGHPYALNAGGTLTTLNNITPDDLHDFVENRLSRDRLVIAITGNISAAEVKARLDQVFAPLPATTAQKNNIAPTSIQNAGTTALYERDIPQTIIEVAQDGIARNDPDYQAAQIMNYILGGAGFGSRLMEEAREKRGLTYGIRSGLRTMDYAQMISASTSTANDNVAEILSIIQTEWQNLRDHPISEKELTDAQSYLIGSVPLSLTSTGQIASMLLGLQLDRLPKDYLDRRKRAIQALTPADIQKVAQRLLTPDKLTIVLVGQPHNIEIDKIITELPHVE